MFIYGTFNAQNIKVTDYQLAIPKEAGKIDRLSMVLVSDMHLGLVIQNQQLRQMVESVNSLKPDIIFLAGDIFEDNINRLQEKEKHRAVLQRLDAKYGVFAIPGNHEYIGGSAEDVAQFFAEAGIHFLRDGYLKVADSFYVVGRDDLSAMRFNQAKRRGLNEIMADVDRSLPVILLDHQPGTLDEARQAGVDLQLSGHTHRGQFFPINLFTDRIFEVDWGYLRKGDFQVVVSSGYGTWGPPVRIASRSEIVSISVEFSK